MSHISVSGLAYAHPGGDLLFSRVSFRLARGSHAGLVGTNGVGKSTLLRILAGELQGVEGEAAHGGRLLLMRQDVGLDIAGQTVRGLLTGLAPHALRRAGERVAESERRLAAGDDAAGLALGEAIGDWSALGGYELEAQWNGCWDPTPTCWRSTSPTTSSTSRPSSRSSGGSASRPRRS